MSYKKYKLSINRGDSKMVSDYNYDHYMALQEVEVTEHKWYLSEKLGHDVGLDTAWKHWIRIRNAEDGMTHAEKFKANYFKRAGLIETFLTEREEQEHDLSTILVPRVVHKLLDDSPIAA